MSAAASGPASSSPPPPRRSRWGGRFPSAPSPPPARPLPAARPTRPRGGPARLFSLFGICMPNFLLALLLIFFFGVTLRWLPISGYTDPFEEPLAGLRPPAPAPPPRPPPGLLLGRPPPLAAPLRLPRPLRGAAGGAPLAGPARDHARAGAGGADHAHGAPHAAGGLPRGQR